MKKITSIIRFAILFTLFGFGVVMTFCEPLEDSATWYADFMITKVAAAVSFGLLYLAYKKWSVIDEWIKSFDQYDDVGFPNPMYFGDKEYDK